MLFFVIWIQVLPQTHSVLEATLFVICLISSAFPFTTYLSENLLQKAIKEKKANVFIFQFLLFSIIIGSIFVAFLHLFSFFEKKGIFPLSEYFNMDVPLSMLFVPISAGIAINACICGIRFFEENTKLKKTLLEYQLRTLQHQFTPHFMFNVLNHIHVLMQSDVELASSLLIDYSEILRYQLYNGEKNKVCLKQEVQFLKDFIAVEKLRWDDKLTVTSQWEIKDEEKEIPSLLFITFIENAFKYVSRSNLEKGFIDITFEQKEDSIRFSIENSKSMIDNKTCQSHGLGLKNIKERLHILYYNKHDLSIKETNTAFRVKLILNL